MKKGFSLVLAIILAASAFMISACGGGGAAASKAQDVTLKIWAPANQIETGTLEKMCGLFQDKHPEWNINFIREIVGEDNAKTEILKDVSAGADVYFYANDQLEELLGAGAIARLGGDTEAMVKRDMPETVVDTVTVDNAIYGIPFTHNTFFMYYDKGLLDENDIKSLDAIMAKDTPPKVYNFQFDPAGGWKGGAFYYGAGLTIFGENQITYSEGCNWNNEVGVAVTKYLINLLSDPKCVHSEDASASELAADRRLGAWFDGAWNYNLYKEALGDELGVAPLPTFTAGGKTYQLRGFYGSKAIGVNAHSKSMQQAVALAGFLGSEEMQVLRFIESAQIPTNKKAGDSAEVKADEIATVTMKQADIASVMQPTNSNFGSRYWDNAGALFTEIKNGTLNLDNVQEKLDVFCKAFVIE